MAKYYKEAKLIADRILEQLKEHCEKIDIAGSIRRQAKEVGDIEIMCLPKQTVLKDLFGWDEGIIVDIIFQNKVESLGRIIKGKADGRYIQIELPEGINLDLFMPDKEDYYRQFAIRTGSANYSFKVIAVGWRKLGWCGTSGGLRLMSECVESKTPDGKSKWKCVVENPKLPPVWTSEQEFFKWINVPFVEPENRYING